MVSLHTNDVEGFDIPRQNTLSLMGSIMALKLLHHSPMPCADPPLLLSSAIYGGFRSREEGAVSRQMWECLARPRVGASSPSAEADVHRRSEFSERCGWRPYWVDITLQISPASPGPAGALPPFCPVGQRHTSLTTK